MLLAFLSILDEMSCLHWFYQSYWVPSSLQHVCLHSLPLQTKIAYFTSYQAQWQGVDSQISDRLQLVEGER